MAERTIPIDENSILLAAEIVKKGGLVVYPTDTVYGLGCNPTAQDAVYRLFDAKKRSARPIPILCSSMEVVENTVTLEELGQYLAAKYWPGALTIVSPTKREFPHPVDQGTGEVGVRIPALDSCIKLLESCGGMLTGTSANLSGQPPCRTAEDAMKSIGTAVDVILDGGTLNGTESTVVRIRDGRLEVVRQGALTVADSFP